MKKIKKGFTLAEILVALGVIGVVAAITIPTVANSINKAKIGPTLAKVIAQIETGNKNIINFANSQPDIANSGAFFDRLSPIKTNNLGIAGANTNTNIPIIESFQNVVPPYWGIDRIGTLNGITVREFDGDTDNTTTGEINEQNYYKFKDLPAEIVIIYNNTTSIDYNALDNRSSSLILNFLTFYVDINGWNTKPNTVGKDIFAFQLQNNGLLTPLTDTEAGDYAQQIINDGFKVTYY